MRTRFKTIMRGCGLALLLAVSAISASVSAQEQKTIASETIYVTFDKTKHIVLPSQVSNIRFGREDFIVAERVESLPNIVRITAQEEKFSGNTNLAIICDDGSVYSYDVRYLPQGREDLKGNIIYASGTTARRCFSRQTSSTVSKVMRKRSASSITTTCLPWGRHLRISRPRTSSW